MPLLLFSYIIVTYVVHTFSNINLQFFRLLKCGYVVREVNLGLHTIVLHSFRFTSLAFAREQPHIQLYEAMTHSHEYAYSLS